MEARNTYDNGGFIVAGTPGECMHSTSRAEEMVGEVTGTVIRQILVTADQGKLAGLNFLQQRPATCAK